MLEISLSFSPYVSQGSEFAELTERRYRIPVTLTEGTNTFTSDDFAIGTLPSFENRQLMARISFQYTYDEAAHLITVNGTDFASANSIRLVTFPEGTSELCTQRAIATAGFPADDLAGNPHWNYRSLPGIEAALRGMTREANDSLINSLQMRQGLIVRVRTDPPVLSAEDYQKLLAVYRDAPFQELRETDDDAAAQVAQAIQSTWGGTVTFNVNENFANVISSTGDPKIGGLTWIMLWANQFGVYPTICTSLNYNGFKCGQPQVGGHVIVGTVAKAMPTGSNSVYIMPICQQHNNNDNVYMAAITNQQGIWLNNYMQ